MTAAAYATDMTAILLEFPNTTGWTAIGSGASGLNAPETDYFVQNTNCISKNAWASAIKGMIYNNGSGITIPTDGAFMLWLTHSTINSVDTQAGGGLRALIGSGSGAYDEWFVGGNDTQKLGLWTPYPVNDTITPDATTGSPTGTLQYFGAVADLPSGGPTKGAPFAIDAMRYGRCRLDVTGGTAPDAAATFSGIEGTANSVANRWGLMELVDGTYLIQGFHRWGDGSNACRIVDSDVNLKFRDTLKVTSAFNRIEVLNASSIVTLTNVNIEALGTTSRGTVVFTDGDIDWIESTFTGLGTFTMLSDTVMTDCTWRDCLELDLAGADISGSRILVPAVAADSYGVLWNVNADPDTDLDGCQFTQGTSAHHAIEFGTTVPATMTLRNCTFTGFDPANSANGSTFNFLDTTGTITLNLIGCSGTFSYKSAGATINIVENPVTAKVVVQDAAGTKIQNARVFLRVDASGSGPYPRATVTIVNSGTTATVTHTAHGLSTNDWVWIDGASHEENEGVFQITVTGANTYTYTMASAPGSNPTGTIYSYFTPVFGLTDVNGEISDSKVYSSNQPCDLRVISTGATVYDPFDGTTTIDSTSGVTATVVLNPE